MQSPIAEYFRFKFIIFNLFILGFILALTGPFLYPNVYFRICEGVMAYYLIKFFTMSLIMAHNCYQFNKNLRKGEIMEGETSSSSTTHVFIIPNFKEDIEILR